jgi:hypothetical protein
MDEGLMNTLKRVVLPALLCLAGCDAPPPPQPVAESAVPAQADAASARGESRRLYREFLAEADRAVTLLQTHPNRDALRDMSARLHELVNRAGEGAASNDAMNQLVEEGRMAVRFVDACLKVANYQARRTDVSPEKAKSYVDKTCDANLPVLRQALGGLRAKFEAEDAANSAPPDKPSGANVQDSETRRSKGG